MGQRNGAGASIYQYSSRYHELLATKKENADEKFVSKHCHLD